MKWTVQKKLQNPNPTVTFDRHGSKQKSSSTDDLLWKDIVWHWHPASLNTDPARELKHWVRSNSVLDTISSACIHSGSFFLSLFLFSFFFSFFLLKKTTTTFYSFRKKKKSKNLKGLKQNRCSIKEWDLSENYCYEIQDYKIPNTFFKIKEKEFYSHLIWLKRLTGKSKGTSTRSLIPLKPKVLVLQLISVHLEAKQHHTLKVNLVWKTFLKML